MFPKAVVVGRSAKSLQKLSPSPHITSLVEPPQNSRSAQVTHFDFDQATHFGNLPSNPATHELALDVAALVSTKRLTLPVDAREGIERILLHYGQKASLEKWGKYVDQRQKESHSTSPSFLPSSQLPDEFTGRQVLKQDKDTISSLKSIGAVTKDLPKSGELRLIGLADAADRSDRFKLHQIILTPEGSLGLVAHQLAEQYAAAFRSMLELSRRTNDFSPKKILHFGASTGGGIIAAHEIWKEKPPDKIYCVEANPNLASISKHVAECSGIENMTWVTEVFAEHRELDLVVLNGSLGDLRGQDSRDIVVKDLWNRMTYGGILVIIEPGTSEGFRLIHTVRDMFIQHIPLSKFHIVAPCPHEGVCPLALIGKRNCTFSQRIDRIPKQFYTKDENPKQREDIADFSFLALRKCAGPRYLYSSEMDAPDAVSKSHFWPRILSKPEKLKHRVVMEMCASPHNFEQVMMLKRDPKAMGYNQARQALSGDLWRRPRRITDPFGNSNEVHPKVVQFLTEHEAAAAGLHGASLSKDGGITTGVGELSVNKKL